LQQFVDGEESRTTPILEGGDDEDIAKMESRKTPIQEQEDDEYIATPDTLTPSSFPRCNSFPISYHVTLGFSKYVVIVLIITSSYDIETG